VSDLGFNGIRQVSAQTMNRNPYGSALVRKFRQAIFVCTPLGPAGYRAFRRSAREILSRRDRQSRTDVTALAAKYETPIFGSITVMELLTKMRQVSDPTDTRLGGVHQLTHTLQALESMDNAGITDEDMRLAIVLHDLGKLLLCANEAPENVFGRKSPIGEHAPGIGLAQVCFQWNHDDFVYSRFKDIVTEPVAWLLRYHSIIIPECEKYMDARDKAYTERYLRVFQFHDQDSKSLFNVPRKDLEFYRGWIESNFPDPITF
jgi:Myo-inositol oxygenase